MKNTVRRKTSLNSCQMCSFFITSAHKNEKIRKKSKELGSGIAMVPDYGGTKAFTD